jgi:hypothetical protein
MPIAWKIVRCSSVASVCGCGSDSIAGIGGGRNPGSYQHLNIPHFIILGEFGIAVLLALLTK